MCLPLNFVLLSSQLKSYKSQCIVFTETILGWDYACLLACAVICGYSVNVLLVIAAYLVCFGEVQLCMIGFCSFVEQLLLSKLF